MTSTPQNRPPTPAQGHSSSFHLLLLQALLQKPAFFAQESYIFASEFWDRFLKAGSLSQRVYTHIFSRDHSRFPTESCILPSRVHRAPQLCQQRILTNLVTSANLTGDTHKFTVSWTRISQLRVSWNTSHFFMYHWPFFACELSIHADLHQLLLFYF